MRNGYIVDVLTSAEIQQIVNRRGKIFEIYKVVIYREKFKKSKFLKNY